MRKESLSLAHSDKSEKTQIERRCKSLLIWHFQAITLYLNPAIEYFD